jgi:hypothetical protein
MQGTESGYEMVRYMNAKVKALDTVVGNEKCRVFGNQECRENGNINAQ